MTSVKTSVTPAYCWPASDVYFAKASSSLYKFDIPFLFPMTIMCLFWLSFWWHLEAEVGPGVEFYGFFRRLLIHDNTSSQKV